MLLNKYFLLSFIIILVFSPSSFSSANKEDPLFNNNLHQTLSPTSFGSMSNGQKEAEFFASEKLAKQSHRVNVDEFGAKGDGTDDSNAFMDAWKKACSSKGMEFVVPGNKVYHLKPTTFSGPCHSGFKVKIYGTIKASTQRSDYDRDRRHWLVFENLENMEIEGGGTINGNGKIWWKNSCKVNKSLPCQGAPTAVTFLDCKNLNVSNIRVKNSQQMQISFQNCQNVKASHLKVIAPGNSPNTDGIHITETQNIQILSSIVRTGDDCVSIVSGSKNVLISDIKCGPGHGISIGSLGKDKAEDRVSDVTVDKAILSNTTNGVRIKSWQGGSGYAKNIKFQNIEMRNVSNPIIVDQNYCDQQEACPEQHSAVQVENVLYSNIRGSSESEVAIKFECSKSFPCKGIMLRNIKLNREGDDEDAKASCSNVKILAATGRVSPICH